MKMIVSDTGPLISLEKLENGFQFIRKLYDRILVPESVLDEVSFHFANPEEYLTVHGISDLIETRPLPPTKRTLPDFSKPHMGETDAIRLALELKLPLLIEEDDGRKIAEEVGIEISGIAGQILKALRLNILSIPNARETLRTLFNRKRLDGRTYQELLKSITGDHP